MKASPRRELSVVLAIVRCLVLRNGEGALTGAVLGRSVRIQNPRFPSLGRYSAVGGGGCTCSCRPLRPRLRDVKRKEAHVLPESLLL